MLEPDSLGTARAIVIPEDSRDAIYEVQLPMTDGGLAALWRLVDGEPDEVTLRRRDVVVFRAESALRDLRSRNNRATRLMHQRLPAGEHIAGPLVICGQQRDTGLVDLPAEITVGFVETLTSEEIA